MDGWMDGLKDRWMDGGATNPRNSSVNPARAVSLSTHNFDGVMPKKRLERTFSGEERFKKKSEVGKASLVRTFPLGIR
jgi:hypothetical protein